MINLKRFSLVILAALACALPGRAQDNLAGRKLFASHCASCHGADGGGGEYGPDIADVRGLSHRNANLAEFIKSGNPDGGMPAFPLPQQDIDALAALVSRTVSTGWSRCLLQYFF